MYSEKVDVVLTDHLPALKAIFNEYCREMANEIEVKKKLTLPEWEKLLMKYRIMKEDEDWDFTKREARCVGNTKSKRATSKVLLLMLTSCWCAYRLSGFASYGQGCGAR